MAIGWERAALSAFRLFYILLDAVNDVCVPFPFDVLGLDEELYFMGS